MTFAAAILASAGLMPGVASQYPHFADFPASQYAGPTADPQFRNRGEEQQLRAVLHGRVAAPNFSGRFSLVQFRIGDGPLGAVLLDVKTGSVFRLPREVVRDDFFIHETDCLARYRGIPWAESSPEGSYATPLSFKTDSELLIIRQCDGTAAYQSYYRWHSRKWLLLERLPLLPPPVF